jgi:hypothetical protein
MIRFFHSKGRIGLFYLLALTAILILRCPGTIYGQDNAETMSLTLYTDQAHPDLKYDLGEPIQLIMVMKNISGYKVHTWRGFSQKELHRSLLLTDPSGKRHSLDPEILAYDPPPQPRLGDQDVNPAETLSADWVRSVTIDDLGELFPIMKTMPGWHTIVAHQTFISFGRVILTQYEGLFGVANHPDNTTDPISSNIIQIQIVPAGGSRGGSLQVQVLDGSFVPPSPLGNVLVRLYKASDIDGYELSEAWENDELVVAEGFTDLDGKWISGCQPEDDYTLIASFQDEYKKVEFTAGEDGWGDECAGNLEREIIFEKPPASNDFSVFGLNSVSIRSRAQVISGNIGARDKSSGPWLDSGAEVSIGVKAKASKGVQIYGDTVKIGRKASVEDVYYNELDNNGTIRGEKVTPLYLPLDVELPPYHSVTPGEENITVSPNQTTELEPGQYGVVNIKPRGTLRLAGGTYHFNSLKLGPKASLTCNTPTEIRIKERLYPDLMAYLGPSSDSPLSAKDVFVYVHGINGKNGELRSNPKAAVIGVRNTVKANIFAPNGTLWIREGSDVTGSFMGKDVIIGVKAEVKLESAF